MIGYFLLNLFLAALYMAMQNSVTLLDAIAGLIIGMFIVGLVARATGGGYLARLWALVKFAAYFLYILVKANLQVAWEVVTPGFTMTPRIIRYDTAGLTDGQLTTLANAITLTPGTLSADVSESGDTLYIHCMYAADRAAAIAEIDGLRRRLMQEVYQP